LSFWVANPSPKAAVNAAVSVRMRSILCGIGLLYHSSKRDAKTSGRKSRSSDLPNLGEDPVGPHWRSGKSISATAKPQSRENFLLRSGQG
jgi:hypothetical protein